MMILRILAWIVLLAVVAVVGFSAYVRTAGTDPDAWHVDPIAAEPTGKPNSWRLLPEADTTADRTAISPVYGVSAADLRDRFVDWISTQPRTREIATAEDGLWTTWEQRSLLMGYPDYISVRFIDLPDGGSTLAVFSRARYGSSDMGVNTVRGETLLEALEDLQRPG